ncbi:MAG: hypothetical protein IJC48_01135 [Clostridia bacterium]|nr:hypothetical protein [Clostridia bacterium]
MDLERFLMPSEQAPPENMENMSAEMQEFLAFNEAEEAKEADITFTEGGFDFFGGYHPGRIQEISEEAKEQDPTLHELSESVEEWLPQGEMYSCAVACQTMVYNQSAENNVSEKQMIDLGKELGVYNHQGTCPADEGKILESLGYTIERTTNGTLSQLENAAESDKKVIVHVDSLKLAFPYVQTPCTPDHAVQVLRVEDTENGEMVIINDPASENGGEAYPIEVFQRAFNGDMTVISKEGNNG